MLAYTLHAIGAVYNDVGNLEKSQDHLSQASELYTGSVDAFERSLAMKRVIYEKYPNHPSVAYTLHAYGASLFDYGNYEKYQRHYVHSLQQYARSISYYDKAIEMKKIFYENKDHPSIAYSVHRLAEVHHEWGYQEKSMEHIDLSVDYFRQANDMRQRLKESAVIAETETKSKIITEKANA